MDSQQISLGSFINRLLISCMLCAVVLAAATNAHALTVIGEPAPDFKGKNSFGERISLSDYKNKVVVLEWTNHECPFTVKHYKNGNMQSLQNRYTAQGVIWLSVVSSAKGKQGYVTGNQANDLTQSRKAAPSHVLLDTSGEIGKLYSAKTTPHMFVIGADGKLAYNGAIDSIRSADPADIKAATNYTSAALDSVLAGKPVATPLTKPYGCSVKY